jgi:hypothetical protein
MGRITRRSFALGAGLIGAGLGLGLGVREMVEGVSEEEHLRLTTEALAQISNEVPIVSPIINTPKLGKGCGCGKNARLVLPKFLSGVRIVCGPVHYGDFVQFRRQPITLGRVSLEVDVKGHHLYDERPVLRTIARAYIDHARIAAKRRADGFSLLEFSVKNLKPISSVGEWSKRIYEFDVAGTLRLYRNAV